MFTPDTFYQALQDCLFNNEKDLVFGPITHGQKDLGYYVPRMSPARHAFYRSGVEHKMSYDTAWLYDQEPVFSHVADMLRQSLMDQCDSEQQGMIEKLTWAQVLALWWPSTSFPIWCTSDRSGLEIDQLTDAHFIICDYWYHAFIARDWYRSYQYYPSLHAQHPRGWDHRMLMYCRDDQGTRSYRRTVKNQLSPFREQILHDWDGNDAKGSDLSAVIDCDDAQRAPLHLVLETLFDTDKRYLTEKVFKPIVMGQAFILWGPSGSLTYLQEHGFQTFGHVWSEEYDRELDPDRRLQLLQNLVREIVELSDSQFQTLYDRCQPVIQHNRQWFYSDRFMDLCWQNLLRSHGRAVERRAEMLAQHPGGQLFNLLDDHPELQDQPLRRSIAKKHLSSLDQADRHVMLQRYPWISAL